MVGAAPVRLKRRQRAAFLTAMLFTMAMFIIAASEPRPPVRVQVTPLVGLSPLAVTVRVSIPDPVEDWSCPLVTIEWPDTTVSKVQQDCDPEAPEFDPIVRTRLFGIGEWEVVVRLKQGTKERVYRQTVRVVG